LNQRHRDLSSEINIKTKDSGELVDTSIEETRKAGVTDTTRTYEPRLSIVGKEFVLKAVRDALGASALVESE